MRTKRGRLVAAIAAPVALLAVAAAAHRPLLGAYVRHRAAALGVALDFDKLTWGSAITLHDVRASLDGVGGLAVTADRVRLTTSGLSLASIEVGATEVAMDGLATDRVIELAAWSAEHTDAYRVPLTGGDVSLAWRASLDAGPWVSASGGRLSVDGDAARLTFGAASIGGVTVGPIEARWSADVSGVTIEVGKGAAGDAPIVARVTPTPPKVDVTLRPVRLDALGASLGLALPAPGAVASGTLSLGLGKRGAAEAIDGAVELSIEGWTPPHPRALDAIIAGKKRTLASKLRVAEDRAKVTLSDVVVRVGKLELKGAGTITRAHDHALLQLDVRGPIACADLARGVAHDDLGALGGLAGELLGHVVDGSVTVDVSVEADSRDLRAAKVHPRVGVGCGLKLPGL